MAVQSNVTFAGVEAYLSANLTFTHGRSPSRFFIEVPPSPRVKEGGTLEISEGGTALRFTDCKVAAVHVRKSPDDCVVWLLEILDRRWKWEFGGKVSGYFNTREADAIRPLSLRLPKQLAKMCLEAMGETRYDVSRLPSDVFPEIEWDYKLPAEALAELCDKLNFRIVLSVKTDRVILWPIGEGQELKDDGTARDFSVTVDPPERPDELIGVGDRWLFESDLALEPVIRVLDKDKASQKAETLSDYVPLNKADAAARPNSKPIDGNYWWRVDRDFMDSIPSKAHREIAKQDAYRKYRIVIPDYILKGALKSPDGQKVFVPTNGLAQLLPLLGHRLAKDKKGKFKPSLVWGTFTTDASSLADNIERTKEPTGALDDGTPASEKWFERGWNLDENLGIVEFDQMVFSFKDHPITTKETVTSAGGGTFRRDVKLMEKIMVPAKIFLRTAYGVRDSVTGEWLHREIVRKSARRKFGTKPEYMHVPELFHTWIFGGVSHPRTITNTAQYDKEVNKYLDQYEKRYEPRLPASVTYIGLKAIDLDGAIQQLTISITEAGTFTTLNRNYEDPTAALPYKEVRLYQKIQERFNFGTGSRFLAAEADKRPA